MEVEQGRRLGADIGRSLGTDYFLIRDQLSSEELSYLERTRRFVDDEVLPVAAGFWERAEFPWELIEKMAPLGIVGDGIEGYGCPSMSPISSGLINMELNRGDGSLGTFLGVQSGLAMNAIASLGSEEQKQHWLGPMARLEKIGAFALTEPEHGSDSVALETTARRAGDGWRVDGAKRWIGNGTIADVIVVWARTEEGEVNGFLVSGTEPGLKATEITGKASVRAVLQADIELENVRLPAEARLPRAESFKDTSRVLAATRNCVCLVGAGTRCRRLRGRPGLCRSASSVRRAADELSARPGPAGENALAEVTARPPHGHDRRLGQDEQHTQGARGDRAGARRTRRQRHPAREPRYAPFRRHRGALYL